MKQYTAGDMVLYSVHGICRIIDRTRRSFGGQKTGILYAETGICAGLHLFCTGGQ